MTATVRRCGHAEAPERGAAQTQTQERPTAQNSQREVWLCGPCAARALDLCLRHRSTYVASSGGVVVEVPMQPYPRPAATGRKVVLSLVALACGACVDAVRWAEEVTVTAAAVQLGAAPAAGFAVFEQCLPQVRACPRPWPRRARWGWGWGVPHRAHRHDPRARDEMLAAGEMDAFDLFNQLLVALSHDFPAGHDVNQEVM